MGPRVVWASRAAGGLVLLPWWWHLLVSGLGTCSSFEFCAHTPLANSFWAGRSSLFGSPSSPVPSLQGWHNAGADCN